MHGLSPCILLESRANKESASPGSGDCIVSTLCWETAETVTFRYGGPKPHAFSTPKWLLQLRVLCFRLLQDGDVGIGVFPEGEEVLIGGASVSSIA
jgi:hypothetical protein